VAPDRYYIGERFESVGQSSARGVAYWDGSAWSALGNGPGITIRALAVNSADNLIAGGEGGGGGFFGGNSIMRWDASQWATLASVEPPSSSPSSYVDDIEILSDGRIAVAGSFASIDQNPMPHLAIYDPRSQTWEQLGADAGPDARVRTVREIEGEVCIGGDFQTIGSTPAYRIACWDGALWNAKGNGLNSEVHALLHMGGGEMLAGGAFSIPDSSGSLQIGLAIWDGSQWNGFAGGVDGGQVTRVRALELGDQPDEIYVGGHFSGVGGASGVSAVNAAVYRNGTWEALDQGIPLQVGISGAGAGGLCALAADGEKVFAGGWFSDAGDVFVMNMARWDDTSSPGSWERVLSPNTEYLGVPGTIVAMDSDATGRVYAGGSFPAAGEKAAQNIAMLDGNSWETMGDGLDSLVAAVAVGPQGNVYAGGDFRGSGSTRVRHIGMWDGSTWSEVGGGADGLVDAMAFSPSGELYVGGDFQFVGNVAANRIAKWDGTQWQAVGSGFDGRVRALAFDTNGDLYAGGSFVNTGAGVQVNAISRWDGTAWQAVGGGVTPSGGGRGSGTPAAGVVNDMLFWDGEIIIAGKFADAGRTTTNSLAGWNGTRWRDYAGGFASCFGSFTLTSLAAKSNGFFVGGTFDMQNSVMLNQVAWWDGTDFQPLAGGLGDQRETLHVANFSLSAGGPFLTADGKQSLGMGRWIYP
jgi:hypothetical protein